MPHYIHPFDPKNKATIYRRWTEVRMTNCPVKGTEGYNKTYLAEYVEYTFINSKGKSVYVNEFCLWIKWI